MFRSIIKMLSYDIYELFSTLCSCSSKKQLTEVSYEQCKAYLRVQEGVEKIADMLAMISY